MPHRVLGVVQCRSGRKISSVVEHLRTARSVAWLPVIDAAELDRPAEPEPNPDAVVAPYARLLRRVGAWPGALRRNVALLRAFRRSPIDLADQLVARGAGSAVVRFGPERVLLVSDPAHAWDLLTTHARRTEKGRGIRRARPVLGDGLLTSEGEEHRRHRRALQPAFRPARIGAYHPHFVAAARRAGARWADGGQIGLAAEMSALTLDAVGTALFGADLRDRAPQVTRALADLLGGFRLAMAPGGGLLLRSPLPAARRVRHGQAVLEQVVGELLRARHPDGDAEAAVLDVLADHPEFADGQVRDEVMTLLLAGHETTALTLVWALAAIDQDPTVRAALRAEWDAQLVDRPATEVAAVPPVTAATLPLTTAVLAETLRLWPPVWLFSRRVREMVVLGDRRITAGTLCLVSPALLHRDPRWWAAPEQFTPDRWLRRDSDPPSFDLKAPGQPRGAFLPFGAGPRMCLGEQFAWVEAATVLAELGRTWDIEVSDAPLTPARSSMTLRPAGPVRATTRRRA